MPILLAAALALALVALTVLALVVRALLGAQRETQAQAVLERRELQTVHHEQQAIWTKERHELLERIQRPERPPVQIPDTYPVPDEEPDEIDLVGTIAPPPRED